MGKTTRHTNTEYWKKPDISEDGYKDGILRAKMKEERRQFADDDLDFEYPEVCYHILINLLQEHAADESIEITDVDLQELKEELETYGAVVKDDIDIFKVYNIDENTIWDIVDDFIESYEATCFSSTEDYIKIEKA